MPKIKQQIERKPPSKILEIHIIQTVPASNANRGEDGGVKDIEFGGVLRARYSDASQKREALKYYHEHGTHRRDMSYRSREFAQMLAPKLAYWADEGDRLIVAKMVLNIFNVGEKNFFQALLSEKTGRFTPTTDNSLFLAEHEIDLLAELISQNRETLDDWLSRAKSFIALLPTEIESVAGEGEEEEVKLSAVKFDRHIKGSELSAMKKKIKLPDCPPGQVALFGRMMASLTETCVDGCVQVAHALGLTRLQRTKGSDGKWASGSLDFFACCDDLAEDRRGSSLIGNRRFTSTTFYRYANVNVSSFIKKMGKDGAAMAPEMIGTFIEGFVKTLPQGMKTAFAHDTRPCFVLLQVKDTGSYSLCDAFEQILEATSDDGDILDSISVQAVQKLMAHREAVQHNMGDRPLYSVITALPTHWEESVPLQQAIESAMAEAVKA